MTMQVVIESAKTTMGQRAAAEGASHIKAAIEQRGEASIIVATGASQFEMLAALLREPDIRWDLINVFHLDEYVGLPITHPASFRKYLWERFHSKLPLPVRAFHYLNAQTEPEREARRVGEIIRQHTIDVCFCGIGENGHLAFNDPPADFDTDEPYLIVELDEACRRQQLGEGWFPSLSDVPGQAISMSVRQIMKSGTIVCTVPDERKAKALQLAVEGPVTNTVPASILQEHARCTIFTDEPGASLLKNHKALPTS
jgi:glucosamine-6-phosphate deaminase